MAKRSNGEGMIRQRADGRWESRVMIGYKDNGKPDYKSVYGKTKKEAREKLKVFLDERASGIDTSHNYNFSNWLISGSSTIRTTSPQPRRRITATLFVF